MKRNWYLPFALEGALAALLFWFYPGDGTIFSAMAQPLVWVGRGLRQLSLAGVSGDLAAWLVYLALCLAPAGVMVWKRRRGNAIPADWLLLLLSAVIAWGLYYLVNPTRLPGIWAGTDMGLYQCSQIIWSALLSVVLLELLGKSASLEHPEGLLKWLLNAVAAVVVFGAMGLELGRLVLKLEEVRQANTMGDLALTNLFLRLRYGLTVMGCCLDLWILRGAQGLLEALSRDAWSQETVDAAQSLIRRCTRALSLVVLGGLGLNLAQILCASRLHDVSLDLTIPLGSLVLIFAGILLCRLLVRSKAIKDDSDLIV